MAVYQIEGRLNSVPGSDGATLTQLASLSMLEKLTARAGRRTDAQGSSSLMALRRSKSWRTVANSRFPRVAQLLDEAEDELFGLSELYGRELHRMYRSVIAPIPRRAGSG